MSKYRKLTPQEIDSLTTTGCSSADWSTIFVTDGFDTSRLHNAHFSGCVHIGSDVSICNSSIHNYTIGNRTIIDNVTSIECRHPSSFGNGVKVATMNECEGRTVRIYDTMTSQAAYIMAIFRHRPQLIATLEAMVESHCEARRSEQGRIGDDCHIAGARFIREVAIGDRVKVDGVSILQNGTLCADSFVGVDVKAYDFIIAEGAKVDNGTIIERCFVGESCLFDKGFTASESLFFANSHCENGEAAAIFAGPYTVTHHKSTLLIAGMFSFFNAGSGSNQSNHLFKSGAVHQSVHLRGCKFASGAYIMSPALNGAFTMVMGHHTHHHDTRELPYSYLIESDGGSMLIPGANLTSFGTVRDIEKWPARDRRRTQRDVINFEEHNPYIAQDLIRAINTLNTLADEKPDAAIYTYKKVIIKSLQLRRGIKTYTKAFVASLGAMLEKGCDTTLDGRGEWLDIAGQYISRAALRSILDAVDSGQITTLDALDERFRLFAADYDRYAHSWALGALADIIGHTPTTSDVAQAIESGHRARLELRNQAEIDRQRDASLEMSISYGLGGESDEDTRTDYYQVRGLK